jgi:hypothetical protein
LAGEYMPTHLKKQKKKNNIVRSISHNNQYNTNIIYDVSYKRRRKRKNTF